MSDNPLIERLGVGPLQVNCFLVACPTTRAALVVDPGDEAARILAAIEAHQFKVTTIVNTHGHFDHIGGNQELVAATGAELLLHRDDLPLLQNARRHAETYGLSVKPSPAPDRQLQVGSLTFKVLHVPGHSPGSICLQCEGHLFVGDVLFAGSVGRTDLPGGDHDALIEGIREKLLCLPDATLVHTGHGPDTTIGREKQANPFVGLNAWT